MKAIIPLLFLALSTAAHTEELWVPPSTVEPKIILDGWGVTGRGVTAFSFGVPDDFVRLTSAKILVIGAEDTGMLYNITSSVSKNSDSLNFHKEFGFERIAFLAAGELHELDVSDVVPFPDSLNAGVDYLSVHLWPHDTERPSPIRVVGLRFTYEETVTPGTVGADGPAGPQGPQGPAGIPGVTDVYTRAEIAALFDKHHPPPQPPPARFVDNGDGTVEDLTTGLIWLKEADCFGRVWHYDFPGLVSNLADGMCGLSDGSGPSTSGWRMPTPDEFFELLDLRFAHPALSNAAGTGHWVEGDAFNAVMASTGGYWTAQSQLVVNVNIGGSIHIRSGQYGFWPVR